MATAQARLCVLFRNGAALLSRKNPAVAPVTIEGQRKLTTEPNYKTPYPYETKNFNYRASLVDWTTSRFNENTRLIIVDGPPCVGKSDFARNIANNFQLKYLPAVTEKEMYTVNGFDVRKLNDIFDNPKLKSYDLNSFYMNSDEVKSNGGMATTQGRMFVERYYQYVHALRHLLSTGQGVVLENSIWSEEAYARVLNNMGFYPRRAFRLYQEYRENVLASLWKPHLVVYLDAPTDWILERMLKKNPEYKASKVLTTEYIDQMRNIYKKLYLPFMRHFSEVLIYDVTEMDEFELIAMDFEKLDLMTVSHLDDTKFQDWRRHKEEEFSVYRLNLFDKDGVDRMVLWRPPWQCPEAYISGGEYEEFKRVWENVPELNSMYLNKLDCDPTSPFDLAKGSYLDPRVS